MSFRVYGRMLSRVTFKIPIVVSLMTITCKAAGQTKSINWSKWLGLPGLRVVVWWSLSSVLVNDPWLASPTHRFSPPWPNLGNWAQSNWGGQGTLNWYSTWKKEMFWSVNWYKDFDHAIFSTCYIVLVPGHCKKVYYQQHLMVSINFDLVCSF